MRFLLKILLLFILFSGLQLNSQLSKKHYIPPLTSASGQSTAPGDQWLYISTPSVDPINFTVKRADGTIFRTGKYQMLTLKSLAGQLVQLVVVIPRSGLK